MATLGANSINFFQAVATDSVDLLYEALENGDELMANVAQSYNDVGETPLLLAIRNRRLRSVKFLVYELKVPVTQVGQFTWNGVDYTDVPPLFAAVVSNQLPIITFLVASEKYAPPIDFAESSLILSTRTTRLQKINILELIGAAYVFDGSKNARMRGFSCWKQALLLRQSTTDGGPVIPKIPLPLSNRGGTSLRNKVEIQTLEQLELLNIQRRSHCKVQAFFVSHRIFSESGQFPNLFTVINLFDFSLKKWSERRLDLNRAIAISLYIIELFDNAWWENDIEENKMTAWKIINHTLLYSCAILENQRSMANNLLFPDFMFLFRFACDHLQKIYVKYWPTSFLYGVRKNEISNVQNLILVVARLITEMQNTLSPADISQFKQCFSQHVVLYEQWQNENSTLLLKACAIPSIPESMFEVIKLLLQIGANPNCVDDERRSPLHFLASMESALFPWHGVGWNPVHSRNFTTTVRTFLEAGYHVDQVNRCGETAFECIQLLERHVVYPDPEFQSLLHSYLPVVRPLSCLCARAIKKYQIPVGELPVSLQVFSNYH